MTTWNRTELICSLMNWAKSLTLKEDADMLPTLNIVQNRTAPLRH